MLLLVDALVPAEAIPGIIVETVIFSFPQVGLIGAQVRPCQRAPPAHFVSAEQAWPFRIHCVREQNVCVSYRSKITFRFSPRNKRLHDVVFKVNVLAFFCLVDPAADLLEMIDRVTACDEPLENLLRPIRIAKWSGSFSQIANQFHLGFGREIPSCFLWQFLIRDSIRVFPVDGGGVASRGEGAC